MILWRTDESPEERRLREDWENAQMAEQARWRLVEAAKKESGSKVGSVGGSAAGGIGGLALDGPLHGATVTDIASGETYTTNTLGKFRVKSLPIGKLKVTGGIDTFTGFEYTGELEAPIGTLIVSPVSTVISIIMDSGKTKEGAITLLLEKMVNEFDLLPVNDDVKERLLEIDYINDAIIKNEDGALTIQAMANSLEILADISANVLAGNDVEGNAEDAAFDGHYKTRKNECWNDIATKIINHDELLPSAVIGSISEAITITDAMKEAASTVFVQCKQEISYVSGNQALNINHQTVALQSINMVAKKKKLNLITFLVDGDEDQSGDLEWLNNYLGVNHMRDDFTEGRSLIAQLDPSQENVIEESYSGYGIFEATVHYFGDILASESDGNIQLFAHQARIYAKSFTIGANVWTTSKVGKLVGEGIDILYRYNWPNSDAQEHKVLSGKHVYTITSLIGEEADERHKEKQAYISEIVTLEAYMAANDIASIKLPPSDKLELGDPKKLPALPSAADAAVNSDLDKIVLDKVFPAEEPVVKDAEIEGAVRTEEAIYVNEEQDVKLIKVEEVLGEEKVLEEFVIESGEAKKSKAQLDDRDDLIVEEVELEFIKKASPQDKEFVEDGSDKTIAARSKSDDHFLEAVFGCTDPTALNFDPLATIDDGSCTYEE